MITVVVTAGSVELLATGYLVAGIVGVAAYVLLLKRVFRSPVLPGREGVLRLRIPFREIFAYCLPLVTTDVVFGEVTNDGYLKVVSCSTNIKK